VAAREADQVAVEVEVGDLRGGVRRVADHYRERLGDGVHHRTLEGLEIVRIRGGRKRPDHPAGHQEAERVDRIAGVGAEHDVARRSDRVGDVGETLLGSDGDNHLAVGVELHPEAAPVIRGLRLPEPVDAARGGISVGIRALRGLGELGHDMRRRRQVRIAHPEIDDIGAGGAGRRLQPVDLLEDVGGQPLDAVEFGLGLGHGRDSGR
jgi:hypothetical protein